MAKTFLEAVRELEPLLNDDQIIIEYCPYEYKLEPQPNYLEYCVHTTCKHCWNREMPERS